MRTRRLLALSISALTAAGLAQFAPADGADHAAARSSGAAASEKYVDSALGNGLGRLLAQSKQTGEKSAKFGAGGLTFDQASTALRDSAGRVLVDLTPRAGVDHAAFRQQAKSLGMVVTATDPDLGTVEGYTPLSKVEALAALPDTGTIAQVLKPRTNVGATTSQGVHFERVGKVHAKGIKGAGMTIGVLSDSYDVANNDALGNPLTIHAAQDVASGDLPGVGNPQNSQPVVVIQDGDDPDTDEDEGRGMLQIVHDIAPDAKLCFATAFGGDVGFADNIRKLADPAGPCGADVIVDDVGSGSEPYYSDGIISDAVDDVAAEGVAYFSSAGNAGDHQSWNSKVHLIKESQGVKGTNLDFSGVDPSLYAGGLQDMNPGKGTDIAQTITLDPQTGTSLNLQWNDPVDANGAQLGDPYFSATGEVTDADPSPSFEFTPTADEIGKSVLITTDAIPSGETDLILDLKKPDGTEVGPVDTGTSPEKLATTLDQAGTYTLTVSGFDGDTGDFTLDVKPVLAPSKVTTDFNLLAFGPDGTYYGVLGDDNTLTGRPQEFVPIGGVPKLQIVVARRTTGPTKVSQIGYVLWGDGYVAEYSNPFATSVVGHPVAAGAIAVGAEDPFGPYLPESYSSVGGKLPIYFDSAGKRYAKPQIRKKPEVTATDRGNTTFFVADDPRDTDSFPNFGGTSAAAPHAAAIAALMIQKAGGPGSMTPAQVRTRLEKTAFAHDLDPFRSHGSAHGLHVSAADPDTYETNLSPGSIADKNFFRVRYTGKKPIKSITFLGRTASPTAYGKKHPAKSDGIVFDNRPLGQPGDYADGGFPFKVGSTNGLKAKDVSASFSDKVAKGQYRTITLHFPHWLGKGDQVTFGIDRDLAVFAPGIDGVRGNSADELGGATFYPSGRKQPQGMKFVATRYDGSTFHGTFDNLLGKGWTAFDGYGLVNAEAAVLRK